MISASVTQPCHTVAIGQYVSGWIRMHYNKALFIK
jgi:hypothetical protein